ncbi:MAG: ATP-binding cassette domain-containing protein [Candidatus Nanopelagicales bacterium]
MNIAIEANNLVKHYGEVKALDGLSLKVEQGSVFGLLGPNGAGKTTTVRVLTTLLTPDSGSAFVSGVDVINDPVHAREIMGLSGQNATVDENLTGVENLIMLGRLFRLPRKEANEKAIELLERFNLTDASKRIVKTYSGGMRRRLDLAASLIANPNILFLDEPTTGLDPRSRIMMWDVIKGLVSSGTTVLLTTQYLEEADQLADKIAVIDKGKVIAQGTADELKTQVGGERIDVVVDETKAQLAADALKNIASGPVVIEGEHVQAPVTGGGVKVVDAVRALDAASIAIKEIQLRRPTLDDVFLTLTGHHAEEVKVEEELVDAKRGRR